MIDCADRATRLRIQVIISVIQNGIIMDWLNQKSSSRKLLWAEKNQNRTRNKKVQMGWFNFILDIVLSGVSKQPCDEFLFCFVFVFPTRPKFLLQIPKFQGNSRFMAPQHYILQYGYKVDVVTQVEPNTQNTETGGQIQSTATWTTQAFSLA